MSFRKTSVRAGERVVSQAGTDRSPGRLPGALQSASDGQRSVAIPALPSSAAEQPRSEQAVETGCLYSAGTAWQGLVWLCCPSGGKEQSVPFLRVV